MDKSSGSSAAQWQTGSTRDAEGLRPLDRFAIIYEAQRRIRSVSKCHHKPITRSTHQSRCRRESGWVDKEHCPHLVYDSIRDAAQERHVHILEWAQNHSAGKPPNVAAKNSTAVQPSQC